MKRCEICDYRDGVGSAYSGQPASSSIRVQYSKRFQSMLCTACYNDAALTAYELEKREDEETSTVS